jgi:hypothetical protein
VQGSQLLLRQFVRLSGQGRSLVEHGIYPTPEGTDAPAVVSP